MIWMLRIKSPQTLMLPLTFCAMLLSTGKLNSTIEHNLFALSQITGSGLPCGILVAVLI